MKKKIIFAALLLTAILAFATTAGPRGGTGASTLWLNPTNIGATDASYATDVILPSGPGDSINTSSLGFTIPAGSIIKGIQVDIVRHANAGTSLNFDTSVGGTGVSLTKSVGVATGTAKGEATFWTTSDATTTLGGSTDLWGTTWTVAEINASGFGVVTTPQNTHAILTVTASIDSILVTVSYTPPSTSGMIQFFR